MAPLLLLSTLALTLFATFNGVHSANILVISFFASKSHVLTYLPLIEELGGKRNHTITMVSPVPLSKDLPNVKHIFTFNIVPIFEANKFDVFQMKEKGEAIQISGLMSIVYQICRESLDLPHVKALLNQKFDLVFYQPMFNSCILGLIYRLQIPFVLFTPTSVPSFVVNKVGGHFPPSFTPNLRLNYPPEMSFLQRFLNFGATRVEDFSEEYLYEPEMEKIYRERLGQDIPSIQEILKNASLVLSNGHFSLVEPKPYFPDVVDVGGIHSRPAKALPKDLEDFISKGNDGFILFSMGTAIKGDGMPEFKRKMILSTFSKLKQQVLWKWESERMPDLPENVKLSKWLPQQDLLGHKDIKMFITHCGGGGVEEAIYHGVPLVGIPMFADQPQNARLGKKHGMLVELDWNELTEESFEGAIREILNNPVYRTNVKRLSELFRDRPIQPLDLAVYWIEYIIRHNGAPHLRSAGRKLNPIQYHSADVIAAYLAIIGAIFAVFVNVLRVVYKKIFGNYSKSNTYRQQSKRELS